MRDLIITSLPNSKLFILTENADRVDAVMRGAAEDLIYTDDFESSDSVDLRGGASAGMRSGRTGSTAAVTNGHSLTAGAGEHESTNIKERKHEALATVRLVNKDGEVLWSRRSKSAMSWRVILSATSALAPRNFAPLLSWVVEENDRITIEFQPIKEWPVKCLILARDFGKPKESIG